MADIIEQQVLDALKAIMDPDLGRDIVSLGFVQDIKICDGNIKLKIELTTPACPVKDQMRDQAFALISALPGATHVEIEMTAQVRGTKSKDPLIPGVKNVIAIASGKGGVGKSTVSCNLAVALAQSGASVGLLDADIYGPSIPLMMGADRAPVFDGKFLHPVPCHGVGIMSIGFFIEDDKAVVWRGPMIGKALNQFLGEVAWGEIDYLIVDLPPGTGDAPMSLAQLIPITGVVVVMTPQDVAQQIANKSVLMFRELEKSTRRSIPMLGVVENMSGFTIPGTDQVVSIFGQGGGERAAQQLNIPFLGRVPIDPCITEGGDMGIPAILRSPQTPQADAFRLIAGQVAAQVSRVQMTGGDPEAAKEFDTVSA